MRGVSCVEILKNKLVMNLNKMDSTFEDYERACRVFAIMAPPTIDYGPKRKVYGRSVEVRTTPKIGRNETCPCGSGIKHKKCCGH